MNVRATHSRRKAKIAAACALAVVVVLAVLIQLLAVDIAEHRLRSSLSSHATGVVVSVKASPATKLVLGRADSVKIRIDSLWPSGKSGVGDLLSSAENVENLDVEIGQMFNSGLELSDITLTKRGKQMRTTAILKRENFLQLLPVNLRLNGSETTDALKFDATASAFGRSITARLQLQAKNGQIVIAPSSGIFSTLSYAVYKDPRIRVDSLTTTPSGEDYLVELTGRLT